ncbi:MAG: class B sortase [Ruminococcus sp.]|nr:class B sortase [Ruminococcus sp.]
MYNCEIYSVLKNPEDIENFNESIDAVASILYPKDIRVVYNTDIKADPKAIKKALDKTAKTEDAPDYNIFVNALDTQNADSFKELFYSFIRSVESTLTVDEEHKGMSAKIRISTITDLGNGYPGYCFKIFEKRFVVLPVCSLTGFEPSQLIRTAVEKAEEIFTRNNESAPDGLVYVEAKAKKEGFISSFIPHTSDPQNIKVRKWIALFGIAVFLGASVYLLNFFVIQPYLNAQVNSEIHDIAYNTTDNSDDTEKPKQNWEALKKINKEIVGWITIDGTRIDYPVLEHKGDTENSQYYLYRNYKKESSSYGVPFIDYRSTESVNSRNVVIHGHNMIDGSMFHDMVNYGSLSGNLDYYKKHPIVTFNTPLGDAQYKIISYFKTNTLFDHGQFFNYMQGSFLSDAEFMNFVYNCRVRSLFNCPVMVNEDDQLITLSTCSYEISNFRTVIVARKLREGETAKVNTEIATLNSAPVFPEVYYRSRGGTRPEVLTFKKAYSKGLINWYDGKGNLEGSEILSATVASNPTSGTDSEGNTVPATVARIYEVRFVNWDGSEYYTVNVTQGSSVSPPPGTPGLPSDDYYDYTFTGWQTDGLNLNNVQSSMTIHPDFKATLKK